MKLTSSGMDCSSQTTTTTTTTATSTTSTITVAAASTVNYRSDGKCGCDNPLPNGGPAECQGGMYI